MPPQFPADVVGTAAIEGVADAGAEADGPGPCEASGVGTVPLGCGDGDATDWTDGVVEPPPLIAGDGDGEDPHALARSDRTAPTVARLRPAEMVA